ncbi:DJ-1 family [Cordyceps militaris]|uniref:DJ-1 family n=1 Tax=Cordyceps militaris TaxID=73501 RepID=A0A2H4SPC4_CORMI|nr:DJ-1 family [Cordyceps militaris]
MTTQAPNTDATPATPEAAAPPTRFAMVLFNGFQALDVFGPIDTLNLLSRILSRRSPSSPGLSLALLAATLDPVTTAAPDAQQTTEQKVLPTHTFATAPAALDVVLIPGGQGTRTPATIQPAVDFIRRRFPDVRLVLTICTGVVVVARAGLLNGERATTNKSKFGWVVEAASEGSPDAVWVERARWVEGDKIWSASGVSAGMDAMLEMVAKLYGRDVAEEIATTQEYARHTDSTDDPFWEVHHANK